MTFILRNISWFHFCATIRWIMRGRGQNIPVEQGFRLWPAPPCAPEQRQRLPVRLAGRVKEGEEAGVVEFQNACCVLSPALKTTIPMSLIASSLWGNSPCWGEPEGSGAPGLLRRTRELQQDWVEGLIKGRCVLSGGKRQKAGKEPRVENGFFRVKR